MIKSRKLIKLINLIKKKRNFLNNFVGGEPLAKIVFSTLRERGPGKKYQFLNNI
jgi:hypothetical protein